MNLEKKRDAADNLRKAFESGYSNAASSLSKITRDKIDHNNFHFAFHKLDSSYRGKQSSFNRNGTNILVTTEIFGDITGKSYLLISDTEFSMLTNNVPESKDPGINLKEEFTKELDNILSASVITCLSNNLKKKMYGDVPILVGKTQSRMEDIIFEDFSEQADEIYINSTYFTFESFPSINPFFIWVVDVSTIKLVELTV